MIDAIRLGARLIEVVGGLVILSAMARAVWAALAGGLGDEAIGRMRVIMAQGVVGALGLMTAATLLMTVTLRSWDAIGIFAAILALRTLVKRTLAAEAQD